MKLTIFALVAALCVVFVSANGGAYIQPEDEINYSYIPQEFAEEIEDPEAFFFLFNIFNPTYWLLKKVLKGLKTINCTIKQVIAVKMAALQYISDIEGCGGQITSQVMKTVNSCKNIVSLCNDIINMNENICKNGDYNEDTDGNGSPPKGCSAKLLQSILKLSGEVNSVVSAIKKIPKAPAKTSQCVLNATDKLTASFTQFTPNIKKCSKLTSN